MAAPAPGSAPAAASASAAALIASASEWDLGTAADGPDGRDAGAGADGDAHADLWLHESQAQLDADADDPSDSADPHAPAPLKVLGPRGLYLAPSRPWLLRLRHLFPQREARAWFAAAAVVALGLVTAWMATTISGKWIENIRHPTTTVTTEQLTRLPAVQGQLTLLHASMWLNQTLANTVNMSRATGTAGSDPADWSFSINPRTPLPSYTVPAPLPSGGYRWHEVYLNGRKVSWDAAYSSHSSKVYGCAHNPAVLPNPFSMEYCVPANFLSVLDSDAPVAQEWPLWFSSTLDTMCIRSYILLDTRVLVEVQSYVGGAVSANGSASNSIVFNRPQFAAPSMLLSLVDIESLRKVRRADAGGGGGAGLGPVLLAQLWSRPLMLGFNQRHTVRTRVSKVVDVDGRETWHTVLEYGGSLSFAPGVAEANFEEYFSAAEAEDEGDGGWYRALLNDPNLSDLRGNGSTPNANATQKHYMETCFGADSFEISVVRLSRSYGVANFLSDLGGFLNLLALAFAALFPLAQVLVRPRGFVGLVVWHAVKRWAGIGGSAAPVASASAARAAGRSGGGGGGGKGVAVSEAQCGSYERGHEEWRGAPQRSHPLSQSQSLPPRAAPVDSADIDIDRDGDGTDSFAVSRSYAIEPRHRLAQRSFEMMPASLIAQSQLQQPLLESELEAEL